MSADAAQQAVVAALDAAADVSATVQSGSLDSLRGAPLLSVRAVDVARGPVRDLVSVQIAATVPYSVPSRADADVTALMDPVVAAIEGMRLADGPHWLGPSTELSWSRTGSDEIEGRRVATALLDATVAVPRPSRRDVGPAEAAVRAVLDDAGIATVDHSDRPPFVTVRWGGTADEDPTRDMAEVWIAAELGSGGIEPLTRRVVAALRSSETVAMIGSVDRDDAGVPPDSDASYETAVIAATILTLP